MSIIEVEDLAKSYNHIDVLKGVSFELEEDEFVSLIGSSGAGKSTLVRLLISEERPTRGHIYVADKDITQLKPVEVPYYRRRIGVVFQDFKLLPRKNVYENVAFAMEVCGSNNKEIEEKVPAILELVGLQDRHTNFPDELSGGEKQRVAIARAVVNGPKLLIADEPTGNLDPKTAWGIIDLLLEINKRGTIVLLATHDNEIVDKLGRRVIRLDDGKVVSDKKKGKYEGGKKGAN
jgi:cell division transport system ATP-binding protein